MCRNKLIFNFAKSYGLFLSHHLQIGYFCRSTNPAFVQELIRHADKDGSGALDFPEFLIMMKEKVRFIFHLFY